MKYALLWLAVGGISVAAWFFVEFDPWDGFLQESISIITRPFWLVLAIFVSPILQLLLYVAFLRGISSTVVLTVTGAIVSIAYWVFAPRSVVVHMGLSNMLMPVGLWALSGHAFLAAALGMFADARGFPQSVVAAIVLLVYAASVGLVVWLTVALEDLVAIPAGSLVAAALAFAVMRRFASGTSIAQ